MEYHQITKMRLFIIFFLLFLKTTVVNSDTIYNLIKIPNLEIYKLKNENGLKYFKAKKDFKIGVQKNIKCNSLTNLDIDFSYKIINKNLAQYNKSFLKKNNLKYIVLCKNLMISDINSALPLIILISC